MKKSPSFVLVEQCQTLIGSRNSVKSIGSKMISRILSWILVVVLVNNLVWLWDCIYTYDPPFEKHTLIKIMKYLFCAFQLNYHFQPGCLEPNLIFI